MESPRSNESILAAIRAGDREVLKELYRQNREPFLRWGRQRFPRREADLLDIFQDAVVAFYQMVAERKVESVHSTVDAYVFGIAKKMLFRKLGRGSKEIAMEEEDLRAIPGLEPEVLREINLTHRQHVIKESLDKLSPVCKELLTLFYYFENGLESIAEKMGYKNTDTVKSQKNRCMEKLKAIVREVLKKENDG